MEITGFNKSRDYQNNQTISFPNNLQDVAGDLVLVDSSSRNWNKEQSNNYTIELGQKYKDVVSIELIDASIPSTGYVITDSNNRLVFSEHGSQGINVYIEEGIYDIHHLLKTISKLMTDNSKNGYHYKAEVNEVTKKISISSSGKFSLIFEDIHENEYIGESGQIEEIHFNKDNGKKELKKVQYGVTRNKYVSDSIGKTLGFKAINLEDEHSYEGQMIYTLLPFEYLAIFVNTENDENFKNIQAPSPANGADGAFALAKMNLKHQFDVLNFTNRSHYIRYFNPPIQFARIKVSFKTLDGRLYNFYGLENYLVFEVRQMFGRTLVQNINFGN